MKLVRFTSTDGSRVSIDGAKFKLHAREDAGVGLVHLVVAFLHRRGIQVEGVSVLHQEFTGAHHPKARPNFIAKFNLDLVKIYGQLFVTAQLAARDVGDDFLMGWAITERPFVTIFDTQ